MWHSCLCCAKACPPGSAIAATSPEVLCAPCGGNTVQPYANRSECWECPPRAVANKLHTGCSCIAGHTFRASSASCEPCAAGTFQTGAPNMRSCEPCPVHTFSAAGSTSCSRCPAGSFAPAGSPSCTACAHDHALVNGSCISCPSGQQYDRARLQCSLCAPGLHKPDSGNRPCVPCEAHRHLHSLAGASQCTRCPPRTAMLNNGSCGTCARGFRLSMDGRCEPCAPNSASAGGVSRSCTRCAAGLHAPAASAQCSPCPSARMFAVANGSNCHSCGAGQRRVAARCEPCALWNEISFGGAAEHCVSCPRGSFPTLKRDACFYCPRDLVFVDGDCRRCDPPLRFDWSVGLCV
ncbi:hypothetical protein BWQ96_08429 [Gracilariopsis chorda]|uniref:Tyrosine-protein kinase ephrin type A/B receptor-like domain-containing protein n=1 Tax=Gracilariopsis chorda TaxID=448386 RepID=A0A2V3IL41_9FLOR|nr:hypothetical protein BWQ96_08429 [Gracilariopsis chorda]|eukprot:PXF41850.1 hypothetical protein BWQ96_08429 [Gracilariopsis chorda]